MRRLLAAGLLLGLAGCGKTLPAASVTTPTRLRTVQETTRVEVVKRLDANGHPAKGADGFDPAAVAARSSPGVVTVLANGFGDGGGAGLGSGFVVSSSGEIATNAHVVTTGEGKAIKPARQVFVRFSSGDQVAARIRGIDPFADVALLLVDPRGLRLHPLPLGRSSAARVGAPVAAIGSPFGEEQSLSVGVVSAVGRSIQSLTGFSTPGALQTDAAINKGNSGGPLLAADGSVLGINSQIRTDTGDGSGVGFAVGVDTVARSLQQLRNTGAAHYAYLGVSSSRLYPQLVARFGLGVQRGLWVQTVVDGGPAAAAGLRAGGRKERFQDQDYRTGGDVIVAIGGVRVRDDDELSRALDGEEPGRTVPVTVIRDRRRLVVPVRLGERPLAVP